MNAKLVEAAFLIDKNSLDYRIHLSLDEAKEFLKRAEVYNYIPENIYEIVDAIKNAIGPMKYPDCNGKPNPNNGRFDHIKILVGNEGSRVIYVKGYRTILSPPIEQILSNLKAIGEKFNADENNSEIDSCYGDHFEWRYWWD